MRKILFIILAVLGICAFISCNEHKRSTIDEEPIIPNGGNNALFGITFNGNNGCHPHDANSAVDYRIDLTEAKLRQELQQELQGLLDRIDALEQELHNLTSTVQACPGTPTVTDVDGNVYPTVRIGEQCWMRENLRTTKYANGTTIPLGTEESYGVAYRYCPDNESANVDDYGYLYNWSAVMNGSASSEASPSGVQGICPDGWHVPSDAEWTELENYVSSQSQYVCGGDKKCIAKALASEEGWLEFCDEKCVVTNNPSANNATGFSVRPAGYYVGYEQLFGTYGIIGFDANFWSATQDSSQNAYSYGHYLRYNDSYMTRGYCCKHHGYSVRCVRN